MNNPKYLVGNWKMHKTKQEATDYMQRFIQRFQALQPAAAKTILAPPYIHLDGLHQKIGQLPIALAAQNCHHQAKGACTGEISADMLASLGVAYVLVGHSERRALQEESNDLLQCKIERTIQANMRPILCCGESHQIRAQNLAPSFIQRQLQESLGNLTASQAAKLLVAYEPVWAIGTGQVASTGIITTMHQAIRDILIERFGPLGQQIPILYGGSCTKDNASSILACPNVDGALVGNASLDADHLIEILAAFK